MARPRKNHNVDYRTVSLDAELYDQMEKLAKRNMRSLRSEIALACIKRLASEGAFNVKG